MPFVDLPESPHAPGVRPVKIHYRELGRGKPVVFLHGGWGYGAYPIDRQLEAFSSRTHFIIPDRSGHGLSASFHGAFPTDFHQRAAEETIRVLDALSIEHAIFWGHSDGAVIAARIGLIAPQRCERLILEAFHFCRSKTHSRGFFQQFATHPDEIGEKMQTLLSLDHGEERWQNVVQRNCRAWLDLAAESLPLADDLFGGQLAKLSVPVTFMHGRGDPRTEPGEIEKACAPLSGAELHYLENGRHSPHSESESWQEFNELLAQYLQNIPRSENVDT